MTETQNSVAFQPKGQLIFNARLKSKTKNPNSYDVVKSHWLPNEAINRLPLIGQDFARSRDPVTIRPTSTTRKTQQRGEQTGRGSNMVKQDQPTPVLKPYHGMAQTIDSQQFNNRWLAEQRSAAMKQQQPESSFQQQIREPSPQFRTPNR